jgi:hypothetical protein
MIDPREIIRLSEEAARRAERENLRPRVYGTQLSERVGVLREHVKHMPNLGAYRPQDWELVEREELKLPPDMSPARLKCLAASEPYLMVDSCGLGTRDEPALLFDELVSLVAANPDVGWAIVEAGPFQVVVGVFRKVGDEVPRRPDQGVRGRHHNAMSDGRQYILHLRTAAQIRRGTKLEFKKES